MQVLQWEEILCRNLPSCGVCEQGNWTQDRLRDCLRRSLLCRQAKGRYAGGIDKGAVRRGESNASKAERKLLADLQAKWSKTEAQLNALERKHMWLQDEIAGAKQKGHDADDRGRRRSGIGGPADEMEHSLVGFDQFKGLQGQGNREKAGSHGAEDPIEGLIAAKGTQGTRITR